jgi:4-carboxymuconolactone decarboxylase
MYPDDVDPMSGCRLPLPRREDLDDVGQRTYANLANPEGGTIRGLSDPGGIMLHSPELSRRARPLNAICDTRQDWADGSANWAFCASRSV